MVLDQKTHSATELAAGVRQFAPGAWTITVSDDYDRTIKIALPEGAGLCLNVSPYNHRERVVISGTYPHAYNLVRTSTLAPAITVALNRGPEAIVKEITRRFLPAYLASYATVLQAKQQADDYQAKKAAALAELAAILGVSVNREQAYYYRQNLNVTIKDTYNGTARLELTVPLDLARRVLALVVETQS